MDGGDDYMQSLWLSPFYFISLLPLLISVNQLKVLVTGESYQYLHLYEQKAKSTWEEEGEVNSKGEA